MRDPEYMRRYNATPKARASRAAWRAKNPCKTTMLVYKRNAARRGLVFDLPEGLVADLISDHCFYCGAPPDPANGIDRVDSSVGYEIDNVVSCCRFCNRGKSNQTREQFVERCRSVAAREGSR